MEEEAAMRAWHRVLAFGLPLALALQAAAASYPSQTIRWVVPYTPGGITDTVTRVVTAKLQENLGQPIVVENKPGANSMVGADLVAKAPADGHTILTVIAAHAINATLYAGKMPFDAVKGFAPVSLAATAPLILTANNDFPVRDVKGLIQYARANPGKVSFGSSGVGASAHLTTELLKQAAGIDMLHVPFKGTAPALTALMAGDIQILMDVPSSMMPHVRAGKIRALGLFASQRVPGAADVPTVVEAGGPPVEGSTWVMFLAPAGTPHEVVNRLSSEVQRVLAAPELRERLTSLGVDPVGSNPTEAKRFLEAEIAKWNGVITRAGVKAEQ
jgi:tripartite-type tricarboxylate transporter receptor subunit TctC